MRLIDADKFANDEYLEKRYGTDFYWEFRKRLDMQPTVCDIEQMIIEIAEIEDRNGWIPIDEVFDIILKYQKGGK